MVIMGYKMNNGSKNYTIKSYRDGGLVETKSYKDGKIVVAMAPVREESKIKMPASDFVDNYGKGEAQALIDIVDKVNKEPDNLTSGPLKDELKKRNSNVAKPK
mgnify:CR=1 FL=1